MSSSSSSDNRSESSLSLPDDAIESAGSVTSLSSGASDAKAISSRVPRHDGDASASEALLALREPRTHPAKALDSEDRRASWQRLPSVALVPRFRRQLGDAYSADDDASTDAHMKDPSVAATSSSDEDEEMPYVGGDVTVSTSAGSKTPVTSGAIPPASLRTKRRPSTKNSRADSGYLEKGAVSPKFRRKLEWHHEAPALTSPSASPDSRTDALPAFVRASTSSLPPDDAAAEEGQGTMTSSQGKRHRHVPDSMQHIACYFCRRRKIKCGPPAGSDKSCPPCAKRQLPCEYAEKSNRGMRTDLIRKKESLAALSTSGSSLGDVSTGGSTSGSVSAS